MDSEKNQPDKKNFNTFARFSTVGIQMGVIIAGFAWLGNFLDEKYKLKTPWWTLGLTLFGVAAGLTLVIREAIKMSKRNDEKK
ncbi:AtpZ/AtpI family protein [Crocinitomicaceae bacterium CZZ-1]|uniref:AtpZ/AtpI family protein n=1 Tax=Taishania pollutisoli TaxID=2766479 RepID=A0A8J6PPE2_9FLAO|nr:AtpZ/AtpI family protein [Taishania pollutisoli]MBC9812333.1 AtpZ/AtpI family protein [Taishania pollutisoli]MBX2950310.1 AtpZ/AtpI family protein [Crocinitomicaceae bacterium]NGF74318.1 AtpZ/AtpI family protein [Fluviicola sp. SGL-29]